MENPQYANIWMEMKPEVKMGLAKMRRKKRGGSNGIVILP